MSDAPAEAPSPYRRGEEAASADAAPAYPAPGRCPPATGRKSSVLPPAPPSAPCSHTGGVQGGVSFGLDGAETIFQPDEIVYNDFATVK